MVDLKQAGWPCLRRATAYQLQKWAFICTIEGLRTVLENARLSEAERDWLVDFLTPVYQTRWYEAARSRARETLGKLRPPPRRIRQLVEEMLLEDRLPGQMRDAALRVAENAALLVQGACSRQVAAGYRLSQLEWLQRVAGDVAMPVATLEDADGRG